MVVRKPVVLGRLLVGQGVLGNRHVQHGLHGRLHLRDLPVLIRCRFRHHRVLVHLFLHPGLVGVSVHHAEDRPYPGFVFPGGCDHVPGIVLIRGRQYGIHGQHIVPVVDRRRIAVVVALIGDLDLIVAGILLISLDYVLDLLLVVIVDRTNHVRHGPSLRGLIGPEQAEGGIENDGEHGDHGDHQHRHPAACGYSRKQSLGPFHDRFDHGFQYLVGCLPYLHGGTACLHRGLFGRLGRFRGGLRRFLCGLRGLLGRPRGLLRGASGVHPLSSAFYSLFRGRSCKMRFFLCSRQDAFRRRYCPILCL